MGSRTTTTLSVLAYVAGLSCCSMYGHYSTFSVLWLGASIAIGHTFCHHILDARFDTTAKDKTPRFNARFCAFYFLAFASLGAAVKYLDTVPLLTLLHCCACLAGQRNVSGRKGTVVVTVAAVVLVAAVPLGSSSGDITWSSIVQRILGPLGAVLYRFLAFSLHADGFRGVEACVAILGLIVSGFVGSVLLHVPAGSLDSHLTPLGLLMSGALIAVLGYHEKAKAIGSLFWIPTGALLVFSTSALRFVERGAVSSTAVLASRDCCEFLILIWVTVKSRAYVRQKPKDSANLLSAESSDSQNSFVTFIWSGDRERKLVMYFVLTIAIMFLEFGYGIVANSLGLVSDSFHMLLDAASLGIGLFSAYASSWVVSEKRYPFGYSRYETVGGFINGTLLLFIAMYIMIESAERILDPPEIEAAYLLTVSVIGLVVNIIGVLFFHEAHGHSHSHEHGHSHGGCGSSTVDHNMRGVYLHILADLLGSVSVIISSLLMKFFGWWIADPICSSISATLVLMSAFPLLEETGKVLLLSTPEHGESIEEALQQSLAQLEEITHVRSVKVWIHSTAPREKLVCAVAAKLKENVDCALARHKIFHHVSHSLSDMIGEKNVEIILHLE